MTRKQIKKVLVEGGFTLNNEVTSWKEYHRHNIEVDIYNETINIIINNIDVSSNTEYHLDEINDFRIVNTWLGIANELFKKIIIKTTNGNRNWFYVR